MNPMDWLNQMVSEPYYLFHFLAFFSYSVVRSSAAPVLSPDFSRHLLHREIQAILAFTVLTIIKMVREQTWEAFIADTLFYAKLFLLAISLMLDYHLALWYIVVFSVMYVTTQQPAFQGLGDASKLTPLQLETLLTEGNTSRYWLNCDQFCHIVQKECEEEGKRLVLFVWKTLYAFSKVEFRALCSSACIRASRCFPELSITYSNKNLSFGIVDLGLFPNAAEKFGISLSGSMSQLPAYILFQNAAEVARFPEWGFETKASLPVVTKRLLAQHFELDRLLLEYVHSK